MRTQLNTHKQIRSDTHTHTCAPQVMNEVAKAISAMREDGPLRDHRPLQCNADDYLRMVSVLMHVLVRVKFA